MLVNCAIGTVRKCRTGIGVNTDDADDGDTAGFVGFGLTGGRYGGAVDGKCCIGITTNSSGF